MSIETVEDAIGFLEGLGGTVVERIGQVWNVWSVTSDRALFSSNKGLVEFARERQDSLLMEGGELLW
jgi:hypothetical protein